jgi:hypothetical protein
MITVTLKAPAVSAAELKQITSHKSKIEGLLAEIDAHLQKVKQVRAKQVKLAKDLGKLKHRAAANLDPADCSLAEATHQALQLADSSIRAEDELSQAIKSALFRAIDDAQSLIQRVCQASYNELVDRIGAALAPFWTDYESACWLGRSAPAVNFLARDLLNHNAAEYDLVERVVEAAHETLRKLDALSSGGEIWNFEGGQAPEPEKA